MTNNMYSTGMVRRMDDMGRIVIPKSIRDKFNLKEEDTFEIYTTSDGLVSFKKYTSNSYQVAEWSSVKNKIGYMSSMVDKIAEEQGFGREYLTFEMSSGKFIKHGYRKSGTEEIVVSGNHETGEITWKF